MKQLYLFSLLTLMILLTACNKSIDTLHPQDEIVVGELLVKFKPNVSETAKLSLLNSIQGQVTDEITGFDEPIYVIAVKPGNERSIINQLTKSTIISYAEPNYIINLPVDNQDHNYYLFDGTRLTTSVTNDPLVGSQWYVYGPDNYTSPETFSEQQYGSNAAAAWAAGYTESSQVNVAIIDGGIDVNHEDLAANVWVNPGEIVGDGIDNDGNGYRDDIHGWDFVNNDNSVNDQGGFIDYGRPTAFAGIIGAVKNNNIGISGISSNVKILSAKFITGISGDEKTFLKGMSYLLKLHNRTVNPVKITAINMWWGVSRSSRAFEDAFIAANNAGILIVCTNSYAQDIDASKTKFFPLCYTYNNIIGVTGISKTGALTGRYGVKSVDLGAPADPGISTLPGNQYGNVSGYSVTAQVTGACALYASIHPNATASQIKSAILNSVISTPSLAGKCVTGGRLNVYGSLQIQ